ncbi:MAG: Rap1a/Tai family immunity protein [Paracoccus sp. (in: a-proteobacteria)]|uniref:Rap1a/Tai family immunity protein n=1 Tax=Paracoccus sp. TaxID=267 RepID=UPI00391D22B9
MIKKLGSLAALAVSAAILLSQLAGAQNMSAASVLISCGTPEESWISFCNGYTQAVYDSASAMGVEICPPPGITRAALADTAFRGLVALHGSIGEQEMLELDGAIAVLSILSTEYTCS